MGSLEKGARDLLLLNSFLFPECFVEPTILFAGDDDQEIHLVEPSSIPVGQDGDLAVRELTNFSESTNCCYR